MKKPRRISKRCNVIGVVSFKGGVGKTSCAANLACALANLNKKVLVVDSNFSSPNLALHFGLVNPKITLKDVLSNKARIEDSIYIHNSNVHILPTAPLHSTLDVGKFKQSIDSLKKEYEFILLDCSPSLNNELVAALTASDEIVVVSTSDYPTLISTMRAAKISKENNVKVRGIILNRVRNKRFELSKKDIEEATGLPVIATLPEDEKAIESSANLMPLLLYSPYRKVADEYKRIAAILANSEYVPVSFWGRIKSIANKYEFTNFFPKK